MSEEEHRAFERLRDLPESQDHDDNQFIDIDDVIDGNAAFDISHAGGEFHEILEDCLSQEQR
jgi:hypothetical protein